MNVLRDAREFGRRVAAARGYMGEKKPGFAKAMGSSVPTVTRWEEGAIGSIGSTEPERRQLAERIVEVTGCPAGWFELSERAEGQGLAQKVDLLAEAVERLAARAMEQDELETFRRWWTTDPRYEAPAPGEANE